MKRLSFFRVWLHNKWHDHKREKLDWEGSDPSYSQASWIRRNMWFLKHQYKDDKNTSL